MTPGLADEPPFPREAKKNSIVAIASVEKPSVPMVVGVCEINVSGLQRVQGEKGRAVRGVHWDGDELWAWSTGDKTGGSAPEHIDGWDGATEPQDEARDLKVNEEGRNSQEYDGVPLGNGNGVGHAAEGKGYNQSVDGENGNASEGIEVEDKELSTKGMLTVRLIKHRILGAPQ